jgi:cytochrome P450
MYGNVFLHSFGPAVYLVVNEPDMLADVFSRNNAQNDVKTPLNRNTFVQIIGKHDLLTTESDEHERARRTLNPAFFILIISRH